METTRLMSLWLLLLVPVSTTATTFRLEAEDLPRDHTINWRSGASNLRSVYVTKTSERFSFPICLYRQVSANITVRYSNDGGKDIVKVKVDKTQELSFTSEEANGGGSSWNVFKSAVLSPPLTLNRGYLHLTLTFLSLDAYGIEIDYVDVTVDDDFITDDVFRCRLLIGAEPQFFTNQAVNVNDGYIKQYGYRTPCPEEDNVHLAVYHDSVKQYTVKASNPLYPSLHDEKGADFTNCVHFGTTYWRFDDIKVNEVVGNVISPSEPAENINNATVTAALLPNDEQFHVRCSVSFDLKGFKTGFIDADIHTKLKAKFSRNSGAPTSSSSIKVAYIGRSGQETVLAELTVSDSTVTEVWDIPEMTWSEDHRNLLNIYVSDGEISLDQVELIRGSIGPDRAVDIYSSDAVLLQGVYSDFWWRKPVGESLTVKVGDQSITDLSRIAIYVPVPWVSPGSFNQIFVLYQDGNVRLVPVPYSSPVPNQWTPFGTSVIVGKSDPSDLRPAASIKTLIFDPDTLEMTLTYYDGSTSKLTLTYTTSETSLEVSDMAFNSSKTGLPFATFRSMFVSFGNTDSDAVQSNAEGPEHVVGTWSTLSGKEFLVFRSVESRRLTHSPDIRLTILA